MLFIRCILCTIASWAGGFLIIKASASCVYISYIYPIILCTAFLTSCSAETEFFPPYMRNIFYFFLFFNQKNKKHISLNFYYLNVNVSEVGTSLFSRPTNGWLSIWRFNSVLIIFLRQHEIVIKYINSINKSPKGDTMDTYYNIIHLYMFIYERRLICLSK